MADKLSSYLTLVLSKEYKPLYFIKSKDAFILDITQRAEVIQYYPIEEINLKSINSIFKIPAIIRIPGLKYKQFTAKTPTRISIFYRDNFICGYCGKQLKLNECTIDHIIPSSKGGKWTWENLVTSCLECNRNKKDTIKYPKYCKPYKPTVFKIQLRSLYHKLHDIIRQYLIWYYGGEEKLVQIIFGNKKLAA